MTEDPDTLYRLHQGADQEDPWDDNEYELWDDMKATAPWAAFAMLVVLLIALAI